MRRIHELSFAIVLAVVTSVPGHAKFQPLAAGSAEQTTSVKGAGSLSGKVYALGSRIRLENDLSGHGLAAIMDLDSRQAWMLRPPPKGCVQKPLSDKSKNPNPWPSPGSKEEKIGSESIDGRKTTKYRVIRMVDGEKVVSYVWRAPALNDWPVKVTNASGDFEIRYSKIDLTMPDPKLFEPPADCKAAD